MDMLWRTKQSKMQFNDATIVACINTTVTYTFMSEFNFKCCYFIDGVWPNKDVQIIEFNLAPIDKHVEMYCRPWEVCRTGEKYEATFIQISWITL